MRSRAILTLVTSVLLAANLQAADRWLHMRVDDADGTRVSINLPFSIVEKAAPLIPVDAMRHPHMRCNGESIDSAAFRNAVRQTATTGTASYDEDGHHVVITRANGSISILANDIDGGDTVRVRLPASIVDPLVSGRGEEIDLRAAVIALVQQGAGDLMVADTDDTTVHVWIDEKP